MQDGQIRNGHLPKRLRKYDRLLKTEAAQDAELLEALLELLKRDCFLPLRLIQDYRFDLFADDLLPSLLNHSETSDFGRMVINHLQFSSFDTLSLTNQEKLERCVFAALKEHLNGIARQIEVGCEKNAMTIMERCEKVKFNLLQDDQIVKQICQTGHISKKLPKYKQDIDDHIPGAAQ